MRKLLALICLLGGTRLADAQPLLNPVLYSLTEKDGLTDNAVNCFFQDSRGIMWMGTSFGLNSFDGSQIKTWHNGPTEGTLANDAVNDIKEDEQGLLWIATGNGLSRYDYNQRSFKNFYFPGKQEVLNRFYSLALDGNTVYLATEDGLVVFDRQRQQFLHFRNADATANRINKIFIDSRHRIWLGTYWGLWRFDDKTKLFTAYSSPANDQPFDGLVTDIFEDHLHQLWFSTWNRGLKKTDPEKKTVRAFMDFVNANGNVTSIAEQKENDGRFSLWTSTNLARLDTLRHAFLNMTTGDAVNQKPVSCNRLYCDRDNLLWIGTNEGVKIYNPARQYFHTTVLSSFVPLTSQGISLFPLNGSFLMGGEGGTALLLFTDSVKQLKNYSSRIPGGAAVMQIMKGPSGTYWICTSNGLFLFDSLLNLKKIRKHEEGNARSLPKDFLNGTLLKKDGEVWVLPWRKGIWKTDAGATVFERVLTKNGDTLMPASNLSKALEDAYGNIWITDYTGGLFKYTPATGRLENIITRRRLSNACLLDGKLWTVATDRVFCVAVTDTAVQSWPLPEGKNKYEYDFIPDGKGWLWIATKTGLLAFNMVSKEFKSFTVEDGLYEDNLEITFARLSDGNILMFAGTYATRFSPDIVQQQYNPAPLLFTGISINGEERIVEGNSIGLGWNEKNITLYWALLNYSNPLSNKYYYKLDGASNSWQYAGNKGTVRFNSLEPGTYVFHYAAASSQGIMSSEKTIRIIVQPPFWQTWWFKTTALLLVSILFFLVVRYISQRNLKEKLLRLEKEQAIEKERNRISRDMHDELGSGLTKIAILSEVIKTRPSSTAGTIDKISETARSLVDNLDEMVWALNPQNDSLDKLAGYIAEYANQYLEGTPISCIIELPDEVQPRYINEEKRRNIFMVVKEFLNNSVKHSGAATIFIRLEQSTAGFTLTLRDDGKGFDETRVSSTGNGLKNMQQRIKDAGGDSLLTSGREGTVLKIMFGS